MQHDLLSNRALIMFQNNKATSQLMCRVLDGRWAAGKTKWGGGLGTTGSPTNPSFLRCSWGGKNHRFNSHTKRTEIQISAHLECARMIVHWAGGPGASECRLLHTSRRLKNARSQCSSRLSELCPPQIGWVSTIGSPLWLDGSREPRDVSLLHVTPRRLLTTSHKEVNGKRMVSVLES